MFNPFKKAQARSRRQLRKATATSIGQMASAMMSNPAKTTARSGPENAAKISDRTRSRTKTKPKLPAKTPEKVRPSTATARSRMLTPRSASFRSRTHHGPAGNLDYKLYLPSCARTVVQPLPLLVMLHGCGQTPNDFATGTGMNALAEELGIIVLYPAQNPRAQPNRCWNWYRRGDQGRSAGEPALLAGLTRDVMSIAPADPARVYVAGLSAGASMALILAATYPDIFAAVGVHSGLAWGAARDATTAAFAMAYGAPGHRSPGLMPTIIFHGEEDKVVNVRNGRFIAACANQAYTDLRRTELTSRGHGGHPFVKVAHRRGTGRSFTEFWMVKDAGHAWSGGSRAGRFTDSAGPDASREMLRFFLQHRTTMKQRKAAALASVA